MSGAGFGAIAPALELHGVRLDDDARERIERYVALLEHWNRAINLVGARDAPALWQRHILDCLMLESVPRPEHLRRWLDVGSGAGLPGVLLAIVHPHWDVTAVESVARKATFLQEAARTLDLRNLAVLRADVDHLAAAPGFRRFDALVARAFGSLERLLALGGVLLRPGGELWAMKGRRWREEADRLPAALLTLYDADPRVHAYRLDAGGAGVVLVYRRHGPAPTGA